jgi:hypothetical protein
MRAARFLSTLVLSLSVASGVCAQGQVPLPQGTPSEEALRRLAAQLGGSQGQGFPKLSPEQMKLFQDFFEKSIQDPKFLDNLKKQLKNDPDFVEQLKKDHPKIVDDFKKQHPEVKIEPTIPKPGDPIDPNAKPNSENIPPISKPNFPNKPNPAENREYQEMAKLWEQAVGPLDETPAVRQALLDMFSGMGNSKPGDKPFWADWDLKDSKGSQNAGFTKWLQSLNGGTGNQKLKMPKWFGGGTATNFKAPSIKLPTGPKLPSFSFGDLSIGSVSGLGTVGIVLSILAVTALFGFLIWKFAPQLGLSRARLPKPLPGLGPWPIDPRTIADRTGLIKAFEYMSVLLCGDGARVWNHATIAEALRDSVPAAAPFADPLAKLYALARYTPLSEELSAEAITEARGYLCQLAGVPAL